MEDMELEWAISFYWAGLQAEVLGHHSSHKIFHLQCDLPNKKCRGKSGTTIVRMAQNDKFESHAIRGSSCLRLLVGPVHRGWVTHGPRTELHSVRKQSVKLYLIIFCYIYRLVPSSMVIREALSSKWWKNTQTHKQIFYRVWRILQKRERKGWRNQSDQG